MRKDMKRILIQGALESELCYYLGQECFAGVEPVEKNGFSFYRAPVAGGETEVILQLTKMGLINSAAATATAVYEYHPDVIINQGTAGAHVEDLKTGDIVIGEKAVNIHSLEMGKRGYGEGMAPEDWIGMSTEYLDADAGLVSYFAGAIGDRTRTGKVVKGILGSGDLFSKEKDRIRWLHDKFGNLSEDMESFAVYQVCLAFGVPCVAIRVISNNELLDEDYDGGSAMELQRVIWEQIQRKSNL